MSQESTQSRTLKKGFMLLEYEIIEVLGSGGFGVTYKAYDKHLQKIVVIKEYMPAEFATRATQDSKVVPFEKNEQTYAKGKQRFLEEARLLAQFDYPSIVKTHRFFEDNNTAYFVMDYYEGLTLKDYIHSRSSKVFEQNNILEILMPILEGLKVVHSFNFLHRDIAPDNIFLRKNKLPVLIDFGAARNAIGTESKSISAIVKPGYSPPEQYNFNSIQTPATDIYAISAVMYEMISGKKVPESTYRQTELLNNNPDPLEDIVKQYRNRYSSSFLETIQKGLNLVQKDRIQSVEEFQEGLTKKDSTGKNGTVALSKEEQNSTFNKVSSLSDSGSSNQKKDTPSPNKVLYGVIALLFALITAGGTYFLSTEDKGDTKKQEVKASKKEEKKSDVKNQPKEKEVAKEKKEQESIKTAEVAKESKTEKIGSSSCNNGDAKACTKEGDDYYIGRNGKIIDFKKATTLYKKGCDGGDYVGCSNLGMFYDFGKGVEKNPTRAKELYKKACDGGSMRGCTFLGMMYYYGRGVNRDYQKAKTLLKEPCYRGDDEACNVLSKIKNSNISNNNSSSKLETFKKACSSGDAKSCQHLGYMYYSGTGVKKNYKKTAIYYQKACDGGLIIPCAALGTMEYGGIGVKKNYKKAAKLFNKSCNGGVKTSCSFLANLYYDGRGVRKSYKKAFELYKKACSLGHMNSCNNLATMYYFGLGTRKNKKEAMRLFKKSCNSGLKKACSNLERLGKGKIY